MYVYVLKTVNEATLIIRAVLYGLSKQTRVVLRGVYVTFNTTALPSQCKCI